MMMLQLCENVYQANRQMWAIDSDFVCKAAEGRPSSSSSSSRTTFKARLAHTPHLIGASTKSQTKDM